VPLAVLLSDAAKRDLADIHRYIAENDSIAHADHVLAGIERALARLAQFPHRGNVPKELRTAGIADFREVHFKPYRMIYRVGISAVNVYCIADGRRDMQSLLLARLTR